MNIVNSLRYYYRDLNLTKAKKLNYILILLVFILGLVYLGIKSYDVFHIATETYSSIVEFMTFIIVLNSHKNSKPSALMILGIGYGASGIFNLSHAILDSYARREGVDYGLWNMSSQMWISANYIHVLTLLVTFILIYKDINFSEFKKILVCYMCISLVLFLAIHTFEVFPDCFTEYKGYTNFKIVSEYLVAGTFILVIITLFKIRDKVDSKIFHFMHLSLVFVIAYLVVYSFNNLIPYIIGHILRASSFYFVYKAIVEVALKQPYKFLYNDLEEKTFKLRDTSEKLSIESKQRKYIEKIFMENEGCYNLLIENAQDSILIHSEGKIVYANQRTSKLIGLSSPEELIGVSILSFLIGDVKNISARYIDKGYDKQLIHPCAKIKLFINSEQTLDVEIKSTFLYYKNKPAVLCIVRDMSSEKQIEKLKLNVKEKQEALYESIEFNKSLTEFFANISHELRTPLNVLLSSVQVMDLYNKRRECDFTRFNIYLKTMKQNCYRLQRLVNNLIDVSKIDSGYLEFNLCNNNIVSIVENITLSVAEYIQNKGVRLTFDTDTEEKTMAFDSDIMERIILNLLSNAIKFTNPGDEIMVSILDRENSIIISVKDTGIGIPKDKIETIFERFNQVDKSLRRNREGSGIGLSLVRSLIEMHEGKISAKSSIGEGAEFIIELPMKYLTNEVGRATDMIQQEYESKLERISIEFSDIYD